MWEDVVSQSWVKKISKIADPYYWLNYWYILISKGTSGFTSSTCYQFKYISDLIKVMRRMVKLVIFA